MPLLRLRHSSEDGVNHVVSMEFEGHTEERRFAFELSPQDREVLQHPFDPAPPIAARIERRMNEIGGQLFQSLFGGSEVWSQIRERLSDTRVEILEGAALPWELLRDPATGVRLALEARSFVRGTSQAAREPRPPENGAGPLRVLLAGIGPLARRLVEGFRGNEAVQLTVLRPPGLEQLARVLRAAREEGEPFHLIHWDGDGTGTQDGPQLGALMAENQAVAFVVEASLAQQLLGAGAPGAVAVRYGAAVDTAAFFLAALYQSLVQGATLGEVASFSRRQLHAGDEASCDWSLPLIFEASGFRLFANQQEGAPDLALQEPGAAEVEGLPHRPEAGFFGRDETLAALDRAFDSQRIVVLDGGAGSGKTTAAVEFARWYCQTGGNEGAMLFSVFKYHQPLARLLDQIGQVFGPSLQQARIPWPALDDAQRREVALDVLRQVPVLWVWDNVETIGGFPAGASSAWTPEEQRELADFLRDASDAGTRFLLTSRTGELGWMSRPPARITLPPLAPPERTELALACAGKYGRRLPDGAQLVPLMDFTQGNPLAIVLVAGQAMRDGLRTDPEFEAFYARLRQAEAAAEDATAEGVTRPLAASASYVFANAFDMMEHGRLVYLHLFQGLLHVDTLRAMGEAGADDLAIVSAEDLIRLLERAAAAGLLAAFGGGYYAVHPALAWFFERRFEESDAEWKEGAIQAYVNAVGSAAGFYAARFLAGDPGALDALIAEQSNLFRALALARHYRWWDPVIGAMQGLKPLYQRNGRAADWRRLVDEIAPAFVDPATGGAVAGRETQWNIIVGFRVEMARESRQWETAERLQQLSVEWNRGLAGDAAGRRTLAIALGTLGQIQRESGAAACTASFKEAFEIVSEIGDRALTAIGAFDLGRTYESAGDWGQAEEWYQKSLAVCPPDDRVVRPKILSQLGGVSYERFLKSVKDGAPNNGDLQNTARYYSEALELTPPEARQHLAVIHNQLGNAYYEAGEAEQALRHYRESIDCKEMTGNTYGAATTRYNVALLLFDAGRFTEALDYARAALGEFETLGAAAAKEKGTIVELISEIQKAAFS